MTDKRAEPAAAFWAFSLDLYARPRVAESCLALQDESGVDVNLLLLAAWLADAGKSLDSPDARRLRGAGEVYQTRIMQPLREARRGLDAFLQTAAKAEHFAARRRTLLALELDCERLEQEALIATLSQYHVKPLKTRRNRSAETLFLQHLVTLYPERSLPAGPVTIIAEALSARPSTAR